MEQRYLGEKIIQSIFIPFCQHSKTNGMLRSMANQCLPCDTLNFDDLPTFLTTWRLWLPKWAKRYLFCRHGALNVEFYVGFFGTAQNSDPEFGAAQPYSTMCLDWFDAVHSFGKRRGEMLVQQISRFI